MFSVKLVWEVCVVGELIPDQYAVPGISQAGAGSLQGLGGELHTQTCVVMIASVLCLGNLRSEINIV